MQIPLPSFDDGESISDILNGLVSNIQDRDFDYFNDSRQRNNTELPSFSGDEPGMPLIHGLPVFSDEEDDLVYMKLPDFSDLDEEPKTVNPGQLQRTSPIEERQDFPGFRDFAEETKKAAMHRLSLPTFSEDELELPSSSNFSKYVQMPKTPTPTKQQDLSLDVVKTIKENTKPILHDGIDQRKQESFEPIRKGVTPAKVPDEIADIKSMLSSSSCLNPF